MSSVGVPSAVSDADTCERTLSGVSVLPEPGNGFAFPATMYLHNSFVTAKSQGHRQGLPVRMHG